MADTPKYSPAELRKMLDEAEAGPGEAIAEPQPQEVAGLSSVPVLVNAKDLAELFALKDKIGALEKELAAQKKLAAPAEMGPIECGCRSCKSKVHEPGEPGYVETKDADGILVPYMAEGTHAA